MVRDERKELSLFGDNWVYKTFLEKFPNHPLVKLKPLVDKILDEVEKDVKVYYSLDFGRPSYPRVKLKMLLLEYLYNLSDVAVCQAVCFNVLFKWFCGLDIADNVPDDTTLVKFRKRLGEDGFKEIFETFIKEAKKLGYGKGRLRILDATHVFSFSRGLGGLGLLKDGIRRIVKRVKGKAIPLSEGIKREALKIIEAKRRVKKVEAKRVLKRLVKELSGRVDGYTQKVLNLLGGLVKRGEKKAGSLIDPDARWGHKSSDFPFFGYKLHLSCDETGFATNLEVLSGEKNEGKRLKPMIEEERRRGDEIAGVCGDGIYDMAENREHLKRNKIKAYIPPKIRKSEIDKFVLEGKRVRCPAGKYSIGRIIQERGFLHYFSVRDCQGCKYYGRCVSPREVRKKVYISECKRLREEDCKKKIGTRKIIERMFGWAKRWMGLGRARYCGIGKMLIQCILTFIAVDMKIMIRSP